MFAIAEFVSSLISLIVFVAVSGWVLFYWLKRTEDPPLLIFKWVLTVVIYAAIIWIVVPEVKKGGYEGAFGGIPKAAVCGLALAIIWGKNIASMFIRPVTGLYDGGTTADKPKPAYSIAITKRKKGNYQEAVTEIWKQLEKFPHDFEGQMLLAEILAENLNDLPGAKMAVQRLFQQSEHPQRNLALALNALADWQLKQGANPEAARQALQQIIDRFPDSELSAQAAQRIAHLPSVESLIGTHDRKKFVVAEGVPNLGLLDPKFHSQPADAGAAGQAAELVKHLQEHPLDTEARERLAIIYAEHYQRVDLAAEQLEQMIAEPNQPARRVVRWLNLLADLQIRSSASYDTVRATLERIIEMFPDAAPAHLAQNRINRLKMEMKAVQPDKSVKLGTYEENIGLKQGPPGRS